MHEEIKIAGDRNEQDLVFECDGKLKCDQHNSQFILKFKRYISFSQNKMNANIMCQLRSDFEGHCIINYYELMECGYNFILP